MNRCKPLFESLGPKLLIIGEKPSLANVVKLSGNFLIASVLESLSEAIAFARKSGVDAATLMDFLTSTLFNAPVYKTYGGLIVQGNYDNVGFALPLGLKDTRLVLQAAEAKNVPMPIASVIRDRLSPRWRAATPTRIGRRSASSPPRTRAWHLRQLHRSAKSFLNGGYHLYRPPKLRCSTRTARRQRRFSVLV